MADFSAFSNPEFSSTAWINSVLSDTEDMSIDTILSTVATKLHIMSQDYSDQLETNMVECMSTMPRLLADISKIEDKLKVTDNEMKKLSQEIVNFDQRNVSGVEDLSRLDMMKSNIERCKSTLEEHARWSVLVREAKSQLESGTNRGQTAERIESMFRSLSILKKLPGHDQRLASCNVLRDSLLSSVRPTIRKDIASADFESLKEFLFIFQKLDCEPEFEREYVASRSSPFLTMWSALPIVDTNVAKWLASNLGKITRLINDEEVSVTDLFGATNGQRILIEITITTLSPMHSILNQLLNSLNSPPIAFDCFCVIDEFSKRLVKSLEGFGAENLLELIAFVFSGLLEYLPSFVDCENAHMRSQLEHLLNSVSFSANDHNNSNSENLDDLLFDVSDDPAEALNSYMDKLISLVDKFVLPLHSAVDRSVKFAGGAKVKPILRGVMTQLSWLTKQVTVKLVELGTVCGVQPSELLENSGGDMTKANSKLDFQTVDSRIMITCALRSLQASGIYIKHFQNFENVVKSLLTELNNILFYAEGEQEFSHKLLLSDVNAVAELRSFLLATSVPSSPAASGNIFATATALPLEKLQLSACTLLFNLSISFPNKVISSNSLDESWSSTSSVHVDNILPQSVIIQVGEHLLSLVQEFEAFASSDALTDLLYVSTHVSGLTENFDGWHSFFAANGVKDVALHGTVANQDSCSQLLLVVIKTLPSWDFEVDLQNETFEENNVLKFVNEWLGTIANGVVAIFLVQVMNAKCLTTSGIVQLLTDMAYLSNVINAMGIKPHPLLVHLIKLLSFHEQAQSLIADMTTAMTQQNSNRGLHFLLRFDHSILEKIIAGAGKQAK